MKRHTGFGLLELMIALTLSSLLLLMVMQQISQVKQQAVRMNVTMDQAMEIQWITDFIRSRIRSAGFTPCLRLDHLVVADARARPTSIAMLAIDTKPYHSFMVQRMGSDWRVLSHFIDNELVTNAFHLPIERPIIIADCQHAEIHTLKSVKKSKEKVSLFLNEPLIFTYQAPVYVGEWITETFFIRKYAKKSSLMYQYHRVDALSDVVNEMVVDVIKKSDDLWVHAHLQLKDGQDWPIVTRVRAK